MPDSLLRTARSRHRNRFSAASLGLVAAIAMSTGCGNFTAGSKNADGVQLYQQGQYQAAIQKFQEAANANPNDPDAAYNLGRVYHRLAAVETDPNAAAKAADQAEQFYRIAIDRDSNHVEAHRALAVFYVEQGESKRAFDLLGDWAMRHSDAADPRIELARLYEEFGDKDAAKERLYEAMEIDPENPRTLAALGRIRDEDGEYAQAMQNYQKSYALDHFQPELASRMSALQGTVSSTPTYPPSSGGTRMVDSGTTIRR